MLIPMQTLLTGGSRQGTSCKLAKRLGIPLEWVKFPFVPACMAVAGSTEWFKIFQDLCMSTITCAVKCVVIRSAVQPGPED